MKVIQYQSFGQSDVLALAEVAQKYNVEARFIPSNLSAKNLENGLNLVREGKIKPIVAKVFPLSEAAQAQDIVSAGGMNGKVVLEMR